MILYIKCSCKSSDKLLIKKYTDMGFEIRNISKNPEWRKEAKKFNTPLPFIVNHNFVAHV